MNIYRLLLHVTKYGGLLMLLSPPLWAGPMGYKDSFMLMGDWSPNWRETWINYAWTPRDAIGVGSLYMRSDDESLDRDLNELTYTRLLARWNMPHAQANVWLPMGIGEMRGNDFDGGRLAISPGIQLDYETQRFYIATMYRAYRAEHIQHDFSSGRVGFSFYETAYDETQPWLILEARRMEGLSDEAEITPMLRLINKSWFVEAGYSTNDDIRFNLMFIF